MGTTKMSKPIVRVPEWQIYRLYNFIATVRSGMMKYGMIEEARIFDGNAVSDSTNPIAEALKYVELEISDESNHRYI